MLIRKLPKTEVSAKLFENRVP